MRTYSITTAARLFRVTTAELIHLVHIGVVDAVTTEGRPVATTELDVVRHTVPEWVISELAESADYLNAQLNR